MTLKTQNFVSDIVCRKILGKNILTYFQEFSAKIDFG